MQYKLILTVRNCARVETTWWVYTNEEGIILLDYVDAERIFSDILQEGVVQAEVLLIGLFCRGKAVVIYASVTVQLSRGVLERVRQKYMPGYTDTILFRGCADLVCNGEIPCNGILCRPCCGTGYIYHIY